MLENRVLRKKFGPKRDEVKGDWRKLHKESFIERLTESKLTRVTRD
jgi:hypothetical protein